MLQQEISVIDFLAAMNSFAPLFCKIIDSSIWEEPDNVRIVFITMLLKQDRDGVVRGSAYNIAKWANKTEDDVLEALGVLSSPDTRRKEPQPHDGRRVMRVEDGWLLLNAKKYQDEMRAIFRRARNAAWMKNHRMRSGGTLAERNAIAEGGLLGEGNERVEQHKAVGDV